MRSFLVLIVAALIVGSASGCGSTSGGTGAGGAGGSGAGAGGIGAGGAGGQANQGSDGGVTCDPACGAGSVCVSSAVSGGAIITTNDAGICPTGTHPSGFESRCENDPSYGCKTIPTACAGTVSCTCAATLCPSAYGCQGATGALVTCVEAVP